MGSQRDTYRYELWSGLGVVYIGITNDPERREEEHRRERKRFISMRIQGPAVTQASAEKWEEDRLAAYRRNHGGKNPRYNKQGR